MKWICPFSLTVFFPVHDEVDNLESQVREFSLMLPRLTQNPELIVVDDGSRDGSGPLADRLAEEIPFLRVVHHPSNRGYGAALRSGFLEARGDLVFYTDGDGQFNSNELQDILPLIEHADVVSCYRRRRGDPWYRLLNAKLFELVVSVGFGLKVKDPDCAFKIYRREVLDRITMASDGAMIDVEMLLQAQRAGFTIVQPGVTHLPRQTGASSGADIRVILKASREIFHLWRRVGGRFNPRIPG
jgi:glycosyltransferase involved in cell wall biosynthesis